MTSSPRPLPSLAERVVSKGARGTGTYRLQLGRSLISATGAAATRRRPARGDVGIVRSIAVTHDDGIEVKEIGASGNESDAGSVVDGKVSEVSGAIERGEVVSRANFWLGVGKRIEPGGMGRRGWSGFTSDRTTESADWSCIP